MRTLLLSLMLLSSPVAAEEMSPVGCNAISASAADASAQIGDMASNLAKNDAFRAAMPVMPEKAKAPAADTEDARISAEMALREYSHSLSDLAKAIKDCGL